MSAPLEIDHQPSGLAYGVVRFTKDSVLEILGDQVETVSEYRVTWNELPGGDVQITKVERNETRPGKPEVWLVDVMSYLEVIAIETAIIDQLNESRREAAPTWDEAVGQVEFWGSVA